MISKKLESIAESIDIGNLVSGIYFVQLEHQGKVASKKIIKE